MHHAPPPNSRDLLLPLLACLPATFLSPKAPPALIPLLAPLLRQRINFLAPESSVGDGWLPLLSWDAERGAKLPAIVERMDLEPHPVSGELELEEPRPAKYRRLDEETLHSRLEVDQFDLLTTFVWCESDEHGGTEAGWKLAELWGLDERDDGTTWFDSQSEANEAAAASVMSTRSHHDADTNDPGKVDDDDDYWASYDRSPARTPAHTTAAAHPSRQDPSPRPGPVSVSGSKSEMEYYDRYGAEVQPALDAHDPDEAAAANGFQHESTLNGQSIFPSAAHHDPTAAVAATRPETLDVDRELSMPRAISANSSHSSIDRLEAHAAAMSLDEGDARALQGIRQHISTDIKSLFRLARSAGMETAEFEGIVRRELEVLSLLEGE